MARSLSVPSKQFLIPQLNMEANDNDLKYLQQKMLANNYAKQIHDRQTLNKQHNNQKVRNYNNDDNPQGSYNGIDLNQMQSDLQRSAKMQLARQYQDEINRKQQWKKEQKNRRLIDQNFRLKKLHDIQQTQKIRAQKDHQFFKQDSFKMLEQANSRRKSRQVEQQKEKEQFNQRYNANQNSAKQNFFKQYYSTVSQAQQQIGRNYIEKWGPQIRYHQQKRRQSIQSPFNKQQLIKHQLEIHNIKQNKMKNEWKQILQSQIMERQVQRQLQKQKKKQPYTENRYENRHHPINNPVDFKITHDNKYIMKQLMREGQQYSTLARSGSHSILN